MRRKFRRKVFLVFSATAVCVASTVSFAKDSKEFTFTIRVLAANSTPYTTSSNAGTTTNCTMTDSAANCNSSNSTYRWRHIQNTMIVDASDGKLYQIGCTANVRWSKCGWLQAGDTFPARWEKRGMVVKFYDRNHKEHEQAYAVLASEIKPQRVASAEQKQTDSSIEIAETAKCNVISSPAGADISVDGQFVGNTPSTLKLRAGTHKVEVSLKGFSSWSRDVAIQSGTEITLNPKLDALKP